MNIEIENALTSIVESFMPRFSDPKLGMLMLLDLSYSNYSTDGEKDINVRVPLYYLIHRPSNYTKVLLLDTLNDKNFRSPPSIYDVIGKKNLPWLLKSDHDSCWRSDGLRDLDLIEEHLMNTYFGGYPITYDKVHIYNTIGGIGQGIYYVEVEPFRVDRNESKQDILIKKKLTIKEAAELMPDK